MDRLDVDLPPYVLARMEQVILSIGYPIGVQELEVVEFDSQVRIASPGSPSHEVTYGSAYRSRFAHFLLGRIEKVHRYFRHTLQISRSRSWTRTGGLLPRMSASFDPVRRGSRWTRL